MAGRINKEQRWDFRVHAWSDALVSEAAALSGTTKTDFVVASAVRRAETVMAERGRVMLHRDDFDRFVQALDDAPMAVPELVELFARPSRIPTA